MFRFRLTTFAVAGLVTVALTGCGASGVATTSPASAATSTRPASTPTPGPFDSLTKLPLNPRTEVEPGTYQAMSGRMKLTVPPARHDRKWFPGHVSTVGGESFQLNSADNPCDGCQIGHVAVQVMPGSVDDVVAEYTQDAPKLGAPKPVLVGGASGFEFEGTIYGNVHVYVLEVATETLVIEVHEYYPSKPFIEDGERIVESFRFTT